ncbi:nucleoside diphosphate kinase regulator [Peteryoungia ipomoeae]|uniref:Nucleoside diphosphate kinase regulator n=1 Tax=Peteryoungia ipomoeae TaxID=1210932 RepID=A0A4S8NVI9_9HYPH|nr:nucleoside diphosphate kinase regulator [Peteryoungia ipomoeae]THV20845.1 nucleoside diphosphate kinase regulator [Peteryoungia ipomoeae]
MALEKKRQRKPAIILTQTDHERLFRLGEAHANRNPDVSEALLIELDRAHVVQDDKLAANVVRMGSKVRFTSDLGEDRTVTLVFPADADIAANRISILTPIGAALIGLSAGQSIDWMARDGRLHRLQVEDVASPATVDSA